MEAAFWQILQSFGTSIAASTFYEFLKTTLQGKSVKDKKEFETEFDSFLTMHGINVKAATVIDAFASKGLLSIKDSKLYAPNAISIGSGKNAIFEFGFSSESSTDNTKIEAKGNANIKGQNAAVKQNKDGSISFHVGENDGDRISFYT